MSVIDKWAGFFRDADPAVERAEALADEILDVAERPYWKRFMEWIDKQAAAPLKISSDHMDMVQSAVRANVYREIRDHLTTEIRKAEQVVSMRSSDV